MESSKRGYRVDTMLVILFTSRLRAAIVSSIIVFGHGTAHAMHTRKSEKAHPMAIIFLGNNIANNDVVIMMTKVMTAKTNERIILTELRYVSTKSFIQQVFFTLK